MNGMEDRMLYAGIVLCGGRSRRMGRPKADLSFGSETLLQRVVRIMLQVLDYIVVVHAANQVLPEFQQHVSTVADPVPFGGPMIGLRTGLEVVDRLPEDYAAVYLTSCDAPFLEPSFVREILGQLGDHDVVVPFDDQYCFPLAAAYRTSLLPTIEHLVDQGIRRPRDLFEHCNTRRLETKLLTHVDPNLQSLVNLNSPQDYESALKAQNLPIPAWVREL